jgi:hypothetical protein
MVGSPTKPLTRAVRLLENAKPSIERQLIMEWYRDPIWQFVGALIGILAIMLSLYIFKRQGRLKKLSFEIITNSALVNVKDDVKSKMQILFDNKPVNDLRLLIIRIINSGNEPIVKSDYETPINVEFSDKSEVLETDVIKVLPESMKVQIGNKGKAISIEPLLLNPGDSITIKILLTNLHGNLNVFCRIAGVKEITRLGSDNSSISTFRTDLFFVYIFFDFWVSFWHGIHSYNTRWRSYFRNFDNDIECRRIALCAR